MNKFNMAIGDWSGDGHGKNEKFLISSNVPVGFVRDAHFSIEEETGINIEKICNTYLDNTVDADTVKKLNDLGFYFEHQEDEEMSVAPLEMAKLWIFLLEKADPNLKLEILNENIPDLHFYGFDNNDHHIGSVGYGLFDNE